MIMTASLSAPAGMVVLAPMVLKGPLETGAPDKEIMQRHERRKLSQLALAGQRLFKKNCVECHGDSAAGTSRGTNLVQKAFHKENFNKRAFHRALRSDDSTQTTSVTLTHTFPKLKFNDIERLERYIRELQKPFDFR